MTTTTPTPETPAASWFGINIPAEVDLAVLADVIEAAADAGHFDMESWFYDGKNTRDLTDPYPVNLHKCGTTACMAGWAVTLWPWLLDDRPTPPSNSTTFGRIARAVAEGLGIPASAFLVSQWPRFYRVECELGETSEASGAVALLRDLNDRALNLDGSDAEFDRWTS